MAGRSQKCPDAVTAPIRTASAGIGAIFGETSAVMINPPRVERKVQPHDKGRALAKSQTSMEEGSSSKRAVAADLNFGSSGGAAIEIPLSLGPPTD